MTLPLPRALVAPREGTPSEAQGPATPRRNPVVAVIGSGQHDHPVTARLGRALALRGVDLATGGGGGVMAGVSRSFRETPEREGRVIGILPAHPDDPTRTPEGYPNPWVEIAIRTHLPGRGAGGDAPDSRNHLVVLTAAVVVALPGGAGTLSELDLAALYRRPVLLLGWTGGEGRRHGTAYRAEDLAGLLTELDRLLAEAGPARSPQPSPSSPPPPPPQPPRERRM